LTCYLLDVNILIALADRNHIHHSLAHNWFAEIGHHSFATCPLTQNALLRIVGHPRYPNGSSTPRAAFAFLESVCNAPGHAFWTDSVSLLNNSLFPLAVFPSSDQLTDVYLLGLAVSHGGKLATLDRRINAKAVADGQKALVVI
jgi:uncharacterized protein